MMSDVPDAVQRSHKRRHSSQPTRPDASPEPAERGKKYLLVTALLGVGIFVGVCNAACFFIAPNPDGCVYEGNTHASGTSWRTDECYDCTCNDNGSIRCCQVGGRPGNYNTEKCIALFNEETCQYTVVRKNNHKKTCAHDMVG
ncbi:beta-microseminoprotein-like [Hyla sarda]|uniref:beta-microseminoprotein-like n=1 Tax=Hyla sarda TaxID=327740 RepID=UPI0024C3B056|nr:beta-microseminoprotein-like [Hyla sarda]